MAELAKSNILATSFATLYPTYAPLPAVSTRAGSVDRCYFRACRENRKAHATALTTASG